MGSADLSASGPSPDEVRPPLVRSAVYTLRAIVGAALVVFGSLLLLVFENALLGLYRDISTVQEGWPTWLTDLTEVALGFGLAIAIVGTNAYLLWRRRWRRWMMINVAAIAAIFLDAALTNLVLALSNSDVLQHAVDNSAGEGGLGNAGLASVIAVLTVGSVWIGPRLRPWVTAFVVVAVSFSFLPGSISVVTLPLDIGAGMLTGALVALILRTRDRTPTAEEVASTLAWTASGRRRWSAPGSMHAARSRGSSRQPMAGRCS